MNIDLYRYSASDRNADIFRLMMSRGELQELVAVIGALSEVRLADGFAADFLRLIEERL